MCPREERLAAWRRLARDLDPDKLASITEEIALPDAISAAELLIAGRIRGRIVVPLARE